MTVWVEPVGAEHVGTESVRVEWEVRCDRCPRMGWHRWLIESAAVYGAVQHKRQCDAIRGPE